MRKNENNVHIEGRVYQHSLKQKTVQNKESKNYGKTFIQGTLEVAVDEDGMNVIPVYFPYITTVTSSGAPNRTYEALMKIINDKRSWLDVGKEEAFKVVIKNSALALNDFVTDEGMVSVKRCEGGFVSIVSQIADESRNFFIVDMLINSVNLVEANPEKYIENDYLTVKGAVFNYRNEILPVEFVLKDPRGIKYFESLDIQPSNPLYTKVWGEINCTTIETPRTAESAFGGPVVIGSSQRTVKEWVIENLSKEPFEFGEETVMTAQDLQKAVQDRELMLATKKKEREEYLASRGNEAVAAMPTPSTPSAHKVAASFGEFNF